mmetsp:Transcript_6163/g.15689  ORF Transcript_6163/g.15689 Transcript_6163/m.15689 type:complete len:200 (-) Transcript_6163:380-979(-)
MQRPMAWRIAGNCRAGITPGGSAGALPGAPPGPGTASAGKCLAAATPSNCNNRSVLGTSLPLSTFSGSKKSSSTPSSSETASTKLTSLATFSSRASGQSPAKFGGNPVASFTSLATSRRNLGGGRPRRSAGDFFDFAHNPSQRISCPSNASVVSGVSDTSSAPYSCKGFAGMPTGMAANEGSAIIACNACASSCTPWEN